MQSFLLLFVDITVYEATIIKVVATTEKVVIIIKVEGIITKVVGTKNLTPLILIITK